jgi:hypothetical protein
LQRIVAVDGAAHGIEARAKWSRAVDRIAELPPWNIVMGGSVRVAA